ncbi:MAG TPA: UvrD-helicase domain-containing protein [Acidimicrobiales bacterium]|nr:UvrD-helicase domain-containing protein [Acidimicrobiales bacterium]
MSGPSAPGAAPVDFAIDGPLPGPGVSVVEASAGTGKTFALTALVARYVAEGTPLSQILAVTFTRAATGELRERVRERLVATAAGLRAVTPGDDRTPGDDPVVAHLAAGAPAQVAERLHRLDDAVAGFDAATITTTHGFCQLVLDGLGTAGDVVAGTALLEDPSDLVEQVLDDLYLRQALRAGGSPGFSRGQARPALRRVVGDARIEVRPRDGATAAGRLGVLAEFARAEVVRRLTLADEVTYDLMLERLADTLEHPERGPAACGRLRSRWSTVLVDEFQDTDPVQWRIVHTAFGGGASTVVLVGDPKQAIYSFRGADVRSYLAAASTAASRTSLAVNWRSDQQLLDALAAVLDPLELGDARIRFQPVRACDQHARPGLRGTPVDAPVRFRLVADAQRAITSTKRGLHQKGSLISYVAADVAAQAAALLRPTAGAEPGEVADADAVGGWRPVQASDVAVLTRTNRQAIEVREALRAAGVPAVIAGADSVFATRAATDWLRLLDALAEPSARGPAVAVALGPWLGWRPADVAAADDTRFDDVHAVVHRWAGVLAGDGVAALWSAVVAEQGLPARVLATDGGERALTDLGHVAELLHAESVGSSGGRMGVAALRAWLAARCANTAEMADLDERSRRLDSDAEAVQVCTVHGAKGLEWGVVYCPYLWDAGPTADANTPVVFHEGDRRVLDVGCWDQRGDDLTRATADRRGGLDEQRGEDLRLLYVALTRARHQVVLWWGRADRCRESPLGRLLRCRDLATGVVGPVGRGEPSGRDIGAAAAALARRAGPGLVVVEDAVVLPVGAPVAGPATPPPALATAVFARDLDARWRRASYTSITAAAHAAPGGRVLSEPEAPGTGDEPVDDGPSAAAAPPPPEGWPPSPWAELPAGAEVGTAVHAVLEHTDFAAPDLPAALAAAVAAVPGASGLGPPGALVAALEAAITTPLGPALGGRCLRDVARGDRLDELGFELPVAGGDTPVGAVTTASIARLLRRHLDPAGRLAGYAERLADPLLAATLRGYLTGSLDLVVRHRGPDGERWVVADYKTNRVAPAGRPPTTFDLRPDALDAEMQRHHYPLQALLYAVALHRYLEWRLPGYDPDRHLGGVAYLFLRGMAGPATPVVDGLPCGVFAWRPPTALVTDLAELLASGVDG